MCMCCVEPVNPRKAHYRKTTSLRSPTKHLLVSSNGDVSRSQVEPRWIMLLLFLFLCLFCIKMVTVAYI